ncbi:unnamed protein product, partial [Oppiella nova]
IEPREKVMAIWNRQTLFVICLKDVNQTDGVLNWYRVSRHVMGRHEPIDDNSQAPVYQQHGPDSVKLFLVNVPKRNSGFYECRHTKDNKVFSSDKFELKVYNSIEMDGNKYTNVGTEGDAFAMLCFSKFDSDREATEVEVTWIRNNSRIVDDDNHIRVRTRVEQSVSQKTIRSTLGFKRLVKKDEGVYTCESVYANPFLADAMSGLDVKHRIINTKNLSVLSLEYENIGKIVNKLNDPNGHSRRFQCKARNTIGEERITFEVNVGTLPKQPILANYSYEQGVLHLTVNDTRVEPPIDIYKLEISDIQHIYLNASNRSPLANNTYDIYVEVPSGQHPMMIFAHNPVGWSVRTDPNDPQVLTVSSAAVSQQSLWMWFVMIASIVSLVNAV